MFTYKKLAAGIATGALLLSSLTPAAFADYSSTNTTSSNSSYSFHSNKLFTVMTGRKEVPGPGDPDAFGFALVNVSPSEGKVCVKMRVINTAQATAAHIHKGAPSVAGPVVVVLPTPDAGGKSAGCISIDKTLAQDIIDHSSDYYVNVHNADYPSGSLRGQL